MDLDVYYQNTVEHLRAQARQHEDLGDFDRWATCEDAAEKLQTWLDGGRQGKCPLDLDEFDILPFEPEPILVEEAVQPAGLAPTQSEALVEDAEAIAEPVAAAKDFAVEEPVSVVEPGWDEAATPKEPMVAQPAVEMKPAPEVGPTETLEEIPYLTQEEETPEQKQLRKEVGALREDFKSGRFSQSSARARVLRDRPELTPGLHEQVENLLERSEQELNKQVQTLLANGDQARNSGELEAARSAYRAVIELAPDHEYARRMLFELDRAGAEKLSVAQQRELVNGLQERKNISVLGDAVYKAEAWQAEGRLPDKLAELLTRARDYYDKWRTAHGQETTMMRFGDLKGRKDAVESIRKRVLADEKMIFDITSNRFRPAVEVLNEAQRLLEEISETTAQYEIDRVRLALPAFPLWARERLNKALEQPFHEHHARLLENLRLEVDQWAEKKTQADGLLKQANQASDPLDKLGYVLRAQKAFPYLEGLESAEDEPAPLVTQTQQTAGDWLASRMAARRNLARLHLESGEYDQARKELMAGEEDLARWPLPEKPVALQALVAEYQALRQEVDTRETYHKEYRRLADEIRNKVNDPNQRAAALDLLAKVLKDERYTFSERRVLESDMDQYKGIESLLRDLDNAYEAEDWERVDELAQKILDSQKAGQFAEHVIAAQTKARLELDIARTHELLENDEVVQANSILSKLIRMEKDEARKAALEKRLGEESAKIHQGIQANKTFQPLYEKGIELSQKKGVAERLQALILFRYVGGLDVPLPDPETNRLVYKLIYGEEVKAPTPPAWPPYRVSLRTTDARREARQVAIGLRKELLENLMQAYQKQARLRGDEMEKLAGQARALRQASLLEAEDERAAARWAEVTWGSQSAQTKEHLGDWEGAVQVWAELDRLYPFWPEIERGFHRARIQNVVNQAEGLRINDQGEQALMLLRNSQQEPALSRSWQIALALAETHAQRGDFAQAFRALADSERMSELQGEASEGPTSAAGRRQLLAAKRAELEREKEIQQVIARIHNEWQSQVVNAREALRLLQSALSKPPTQDSRRLMELREEIYTKAEESLLKTARQEKARGTDDGKIQAVAALVDLRELETIIKRPPEDCRSTSELNSLRAELAPAAKAINLKAREFDPVNLSLEQAVREAGLLAGRLQSFSSVIPIFKEELGGIQEGLEKQRIEITKTYDHLQQLQELLKKALETGLWEAALQTGDFAPLEQFQRQVQALGLGGMLEVQNYATRIQEWREVHNRLAQDIATVKNKFEAEEDFDGVVIHIRRLRVRYDLRLDNQPWRQVLQKDYLSILYTLRRKLIISDVYGNSSERFLEGWDQVEQVALERGIELSWWENWRNECERLGIQLEQVKDKVKANAPETPIVQRLSDWQAVEGTAAILLKLLEQGPQNGGEAISIHSNKTKNFEKERQDRRNRTHSDLTKARIEIARLTPELEGPGKGFPKAKEFDTAVKQKNLESLARLLERAKRVGASNAQEAGMIRLYETTLNEALAKMDHHNSTERRFKFPWQKV